MDIRWFNYSVQFRGRRIFEVFSRDSKDGHFWGIGSPRIVYIGTDDAQRRSIIVCGVRLFSWRPTP